jgi:PhnB protein
MTISPYLIFKNECEEALTFYAQALKGKLTLLRFGEANFGNGFKVDESIKNNIMHGEVIGDNYRLMGSDIYPGMSPEPMHSGDVAVTLMPTSESEAEHIFKALSDNATIHMPLQPTEWAKKFGMLVDKYGIRWQISYEG